MRAEIGPCWEWTGGKVSKGYGHVWIGDRGVGAHRLAWFLETGRWPEPCALHHCDNPSCVRFTHLFEGNNFDNQQDSRRKGRLRTPDVRGEKHPAARLTTEQVESIRARYPQETGKNLAKEFGVRPSQISRIVNQRRWR
jgi:hypothetical protein